MSRMSLAISLAMAASNGREKEKAARWAAAWGRVLGITPAPGASDGRQRADSGPQQASQ